MQDAFYPGLTPEAADKLIAAHDGTLTLLYVWHLRRAGTDAELAAGELCLTLREVNDACEKLTRMGLWSAAQPAGTAAAPAAAARQALPPKAELSVPEPAEELPAYTVEDVTARAAEDSLFRHLQTESAKVLGRRLNTEEAKKLLGIYAHLGMPCEVIMMLLHYCAEDCAARYGEGKRPGMRYIEKEAFIWARNRLFSLEAAEAFIAARGERQQKLHALQEAVQIHGRSLTPSEERYLSSWADMGFGAQAVAIAYDRTVTNTGKLSWNYLNKILLSWHAAGLHSPAEIEEKDGRRPAGARSQGSTPAAVDSETAQDILNGSILDKI